MSPKTDKLSASINLPLTKIRRTIGNEEYIHFAFFYAPDFNEIVHRKRKGRSRIYRFRWWCGAGSAVQICISQQNQAEIL